jgi:hypothetical protein
VFLLLQACLGLEITGEPPRISFVRPALPAFLGEAKILNLRVANSTVDLLLTRHDQGVGLKVLRREGDVEIVAIV